MTEEILMKKYRVIKPWTPKYPDPIILKKDDIVTVGIEDDEYPGWFWCEKDKKSGWVTEEVLIRYVAGSARIMEDYSSRELAVVEGDLFLGKREIGGWIEGTHSNENGWIPLHILEEIEEYVHSDMFILFVKDQVRSRDFYWKLLDKAPFIDVPGMTEFLLQSGMRLGIMPEEGIERILDKKIENVPRFGPELYFLVDDPTETYARAIHLGAEQLREPTKMDWGAVVAYVMDMDGYVLAFAKPTK